MDRPRRGSSEDNSFEHRVRSARSGSFCLLHVEAPDGELDGLAQRLMKADHVEAAYVKPPGELPQIINDMLPHADEAPATTPNFVARQIYLNAAPAGIDAQYAWTQPGGGGAGVKIIDCEWAWRYTREDLIQNQGGVMAGTQVNDLDARNHGTAVIGEFGGDRNTFGITGENSEKSI